MIKKFWRWTVVIVANSVTVPTAAEPYTLIKMVNFVMYSLPQLYTYMYNSEENKLLSGKGKTKLC